MPESSPALPHWAFQILQGLALFVGGGTIVKLITIYQNRNKPKAEVNETEARTTEITVRSNTVAGDAVIRMMDRLDEALDNIDRLREERDGYKQTAEMQKIELELSDVQMVRMKSIMALKGVHLSDYDNPKE